MTTTEEGNKLIAEFMEVEGTWDDILKATRWVSKIPFTQNGYVISHLLKYHLSWDWLLPVLIKIESLGYRWEIGMAEDSPIHYCKVWSIGKVKGISPIDATWGAIIEFIKWYNI